MIRSLAAAVFVAAMLLILWILRDGDALVPGATNGGVALGELAADGAGSESVFKIEIIEGADEAQLHYEEILAQYGADPVAQAWVGECLAAGAPDGTTSRETWERACWYSYEATSR